MELFHFIVVPIEVVMVVMVVVDSVDLVYVVVDQQEVQVQLIKVVALV